MPTGDRVRRRALGWRSPGTRRGSRRAAGRIHFLVSNNCSRPGLSARYAELTKRGTPPIGHPLQRHPLGETVSRYMPLWERVPRSVFDRDAGLDTDQFESHFNFRRLLRREARVPPAEHEALARFPDRDAPDLERFAVIEMRDEAASGTRLEGQLTVTARGDREKTVRTPPRGNLTRECLECSRRIDRHAQGDEDLRGHLRVFCRCALSADNCRAHKASVSASQLLSPAIASGRRR